MIRFVFQALLSNISKEHISFYLTNILLFSLPSQTQCHCIISQNYTDNGWLRFLT